MRLATWFLLGWFFCGIAPGQKIGEVPRQAPDAKAPRGETLEWTSSAGRPYWYRLPKERKKGAPPALVLMLHGTGLNHGWSFWNYGIARGTFRPHDIVVSPDGVTPGANGTFNFVQNAQDGAQISELIQLFRKRFEIGNVYLYGHSQGAFFSFWYAGEHPELVDGIIAHAGNVLQVKHSALAKKNLAVAILHGASDQVVPVSCAHRSHEIYRKEGYQKLRLEIVEGLRPEAGHWPLPNQVSELFEWLDQVSVKTLSGALALAGQALLAEKPDVGLMMQARADAKRLAPRRMEESDSRRLALLDELTNALASAHADAILEEARRLDRKDPLQRTRFRVGHAVLGESGVWQKRFRTEVGIARREAAQMRKLRAGLEAGAKRALGAAVKAVEKGALAPEFDELLPELAKALEAADADGKLATRGKAALAAARERLDAATRSRDVRSLEVVGQFRERLQDAFGPR